MELAEVAVPPVAQDGDDRVPRAERSGGAEGPDAVDRRGAPEEKAVVQQKVPG